MAEEGKQLKLIKVAKEFNISLDTVVEFFKKKNVTVERAPNFPVSQEMYSALEAEYRKEKELRQAAEKIQIGTHRKPTGGTEEHSSAPKTPTPADDEPVDEVLIKNNSVAPIKPEPVAESPKTETPEPKAESPAPVEKPIEVEAAPAAPSNGPTVLGKIDLSQFDKKKKQEKKPEPAKPSAPAPVESPKAEKPVETPKPEKPVAEKAPDPVVEKPQPKVEQTAPKSEPTPAPVAESPKQPEPKQEAPKQETPKQETPKQETPAPEAPEQAAAPVEDQVIRATAERLSGTTVIGRIDLSQFDKKKKPVASATASGDITEDGKKKRKRKKTGTGAPNQGQPGAGNNQGGNNQGGNNQGNRGPGGNNQGNRGPGGNNQGNRGPGGNNRGPGGNNRGPGGNRNAPKAAPAAPVELTEKQIQDQIKATMARLTNNQSKFGNRAKLRKQKRQDFAEEMRQQMEEQELESRILKVTEFLTTSELAKLMDVQVNEVISKVFMLGMMVSINQRLDAETISLVADEFGFEVEFQSASAEEPNLEEDDAEEMLEPRAPIVTIMGHVDHGKTSLLDYIRKANVIAGEAGGITQHIGAYEVELKDGKKICFLDTPGHEAFTAMRARGAQVTDIVVIVISADDSVMPQTKEAISHAQAAGVPIIFALNKIDRPEANPDRIREQLAGMNILVEEWGGKYQCQEISAKKGLNVDLLLEKILLEAEILDLKAVADKRAIGTIIEASLDKGKGIVTTVLVQKGTLRVGDPILAGAHFGKVKALMNERGVRIKEAGPSQPAQVLGFPAAPTAGDKLYVPESEAAGKEIANKRQQLLREQGLRTKKHITLDEIGRRLAIGNFQELNVVIKADVDGSAEALADSLEKLSTEAVKVNVIYKGVGQISESDVLLASASDAIIVGFQVRPFPQARRLAENEQIDIRLYSIIYDAIEEIKSAMEGMLAPTFEEKIIANVEIREVFKITKVGSVAGCMVLDGKLTRNTKIRLIRDGVVIYSGELASLKRFKDDAKEVTSGMECGMQVKNYNDIKVGDIIEGYERIEKAGKL